MTSAAAEPAAGWTAVCRYHDLQPERGAAALLGGVQVALFRTFDGTVYAIDDTCTHEDCSLSEGELSHHLVECPCHGSRFDVRTGEVLNLPAVIPVGTYRVAVTGDQVLVDVDAKPVG